MCVISSEIVVLVNLIKILLDLFFLTFIQTNQTIAQSYDAMVLIFLRIIYQNVYDLFMIVLGIASVSCRSMYAVMPSRNQVTGFFKDGKVPKNLKEGCRWLLFNMFEVLHQQKEGLRENVYNGVDISRKSKKITVQMPIGYLTRRKRYIFRDTKPSWSADQRLDFVLTHSFKQFSICSSPRLGQYITYTTTFLTVVKQEKIDILLMFLSFTL